jgi:hypothetical protein
MCCSHLSAESVDSIYLKYKEGCIKMHRVIVLCLPHGNTRLVTCPCVDIDHFIVQNNKTLQNFSLLDLRYPRKGNYNMSFCLFLKLS